MRILVVEDDAKIGEFVSKGLREAGYVVDHVASAEEALPIFVSGTVDAAIVDIMLPAPAGQDTRAALAASSSTSRPCEAKRRRSASLSTRRASASTRACSRRR